MQRMEAGALGEIELTNEQIKAATLVLAKVVPDLQRIENSHTGKVDLTLIAQARDKFRALTEG